MYTEKVLTISIASYNVENYLPQCLDSLCTSTMLESIQIVIVDDGSSDGTADLAYTYMHQYPDSITVISKDNGGYGSTINASLKVADGKYYRLLDADDWVKTDGFDTYVKYLSNCDADMVLTRFFRVYEGREPEEIDLGMTFDDSVKSFEEASPEEAIPMHMLTFKTEILRNNGISISEGHPYTDFEFVMKPIPMVASIAFCDAGVYCYRLGRDGQSVSLDSWQRNIALACDVTLGMCSYYEDIKRTKRLSASKDDYIRRSIIGSIDNKYKYLFSIPPNKITKLAIRDFDLKLAETSDDLYGASIREGDRRVRFIRTLGIRLYYPVARIVSYYLLGKDKR